MNRVKLARFEKGLTVREVVEGAGVAKSTLLRVEAGSMPTAPVAQALAEFYGLGILELWPPTPTEPVEDVAA